MFLSQFVDSAPGRSAARLTLAPLAAKRERNPANRHHVNQTAHVSTTPLKNLPPSARPIRIIHGERRIRLANRRANRLGPRTLLRGKLVRRLIRPHQRDIERRHRR